MTADLVKPDVVDTPVEVAEHAHACANCGAHLQGAFCHACGQRGHLHGRLWHLVEEFAEGIAHFDGRLWRTLPLLALNPGRLSREWRVGRRVRYVAPLHVFLFAVFVFFLIPSFTGRHYFVLPERAEVQAARTEATRTGRPVKQEVLPGVNATLAGEDDPLPADAPDWMINIGEYFSARLKNPEYYGYKIETLAYKLSFVMVPISVLILALVLAFKRGFTWYDHSVVTLYGYGFAVLLFAVGAALPQGAAAERFGEVLAFVIPAHAVAHLRGAYGLSWAGAVLRGLVLGLLSLAGFGLFVSGVVALGLGG